MDSLSRWFVHLVDLRSLFEVWESLRSSGALETRRSREIESACLFALCVEHRTNQRYLVGFPVKGIPKERVRIKQLFDGTFGEIDDWDFVLVDDPKTFGESNVAHHCCQLVRYTRQPSTCEKHLVEFLEKKKLQVPRDDDLRLVIHVDQEGPINHEFLHAYLTVRSPKCPYSQVFLIGQLGGEPRRWMCTQVYPEYAVCPELSESEATALLCDRKQYNKIISAKQTD